MSRTLRISCIILLLFALLLPTTALAVSQKTAVLEEVSKVIDLADGSTLQLEASVLPANASQAVTYKSSNTAIATVSTKGLVTFKKTGTVTIGVRPRTKTTWTKVTFTVMDSLKPTSMTLSSGNVSLQVGQTMTLTATCLPDGTAQGVKYATSKSSVASVTQAGVITAKKAGKAKIRVTSTRNTSLYKDIIVTVTAVPAPKSITITPSDAKTVNIGETLQLTGTPNPSTAGQAVGWSTSSSSIATVSSTGLVTAKKAGTVKITCYSKIKSSVRTVRTITVINPNAITGVTLTESDTIYLSEGENETLHVTVKPSTANQSVTWKSSNSSVVSVSESGEITAKSPGTALVTVSSSVLSSKKDSVTVVVLDATRTTTIPARTTNVSGISANLAKIDAIKNSAYNEITALLANGKITEIEAETRKSIVNNAFAMYRFPWMTSKKQAYWTSSYNGAKDFLVGTVYYGLPYIQCGTNNVYTNRMYNVVKAVNNGYYTKTSSGYYMMTSKRLNGMYVGNDCSAFVSVATWGTSHPASFLATKYMATSKYYNTISGYDNLRPGDALVKSGSHTVMFLYFTNSAHTKMMIIEQGGGTNPGGSDMHNTVCCSVVNVSSYKNNGYVIRRATVLSAK